MKKIFIGVPMHNAADSVIECLSRIPQFCHKYNWLVRVIDDWSEPQESKKVLKASLSRAFRLRYGYTHVRDILPTPCPNLGGIVNYLLDSVPKGFDYYLNLESDVYLHPDTLPMLIDGIEKTGAPMACPMQLTEDGKADFIFWGGGIQELDRVHPFLQQSQRPKWCNLGCLLIRGDVARDKDCRVDDEQFTLFCVDQDLTSTIAQKYGRPLYVPTAKVTHKGRQSTREGQPGGHTAHEAVRRINAKWRDYLVGGLF